MESQNDIGMILNCTYQGVSLAGTFTKDGVKAIYKMIMFLHYAAEKRRITKSGRIGRRTMNEKYGSAVIYKEMRFVAAELQKRESQNRDSLLKEKDFKKMRPTQKEERHNFEKLAKKHGLNYILFQATKESCILQIPKEQEAIYEKVYEQHCAWIKKENMTFNREVAKDRNEEAQEAEQVSKEKKTIAQEEVQIKKVNGQDVYDSMTPESKEVIANPYKSLKTEQALEIIANLTDEQYVKNMQETFPNYNKENLTVVQSMEMIKSDVTLSEEKKKEIFRAFADNEQINAREMGKIKDFTVNRNQMMVQQVNGKTMLTFIHPQHPNTQITVDSTNLCGRIKWMGYNANFSLYKDCAIKATTTKLVVGANGSHKKKTEFMGTVAELDAKVTKDAQMAKKAYLRARKQARSKAMKQTPVKVR